MKVLSLFSGIGAFEKALNRIGIETEIVNYCEIDKYASKAYSVIHNVSEEKNLGDITKIEIEKLPRFIDMITHGSPCQDFSVAGKQAGGDEGTGTRSSLMWNTVDIVKWCLPKYVIWENVKNLLSKKHKHNFDSYIEIMEQLGYNSYYQVLNAKDYGIPQNRERVYTISIRKDIDKCNYKFPEKEVLKLRLKDLLEDIVDEKYYLEDKQIKRIKTTTYNVGKTRIQKKEYCDILCARDWKDPKCVEIDNPKVINPFKNKTEYGWHFEQQVYDSNGITRSVKAGGGSGNIPKVVEHPELIQVGELDMKGHEQMKRFYSSEGLSPTLTTMGGGNREPKIIVEGNYMPSGHDASRIVNENGLAPTVKENHGAITAVNISENNNNFRIRKLTPKECWRLMGFDDEDFERVKQIPTSNTQLYKMAGNSIVVNVLQKIFKNLLLEEIDE